MPLFTNILFPVDFSDRSRAAAPFVLSMGRHYQSKVTLLHVIQPPPIYPGMNNIDLAMLNPASLQVNLNSDCGNSPLPNCPKWT